MLYSPHSKGDSNEKTTLDSRLERLKCSLSRRQRVCKRKATCAEPTANHSTNVSCNAEDERYRHKLRKMVRRARVLKYSWGENSCGCCSKASIAPSVPKVVTKDMPQPVKNFYFGTRLLQIDALSNLQPSSVDEAIAEAETNMAAYESWARQQLWPNSSCSPKASTASRT